MKDEICKLDVDGTQARNTITGKGERGENGSTLINRLKKLIEYERL